MLAVQDNAVGRVDSPDAAVCDAEGVIELLVWRGDLLSTISTGGKYGKEDDEGKQGFVCSVVSCGIGGKLEDEEGGAVVCCSSFNASLARFRAAHSSLFSYFCALLSLNTSTSCEHSVLL